MTGLREWMRDCLPAIEQGVTSGDLVANVFVADPLASPAEAGLFVVDVLVYEAGDPKEPVSAWLDEHAHADGRFVGFALVMREYGQQVWLFGGVEKGGGNDVLIRRRAGKWEGIGRDDVPLVVYGMIGTIRKALEAGDSVAPYMKDSAEDPMEKWMTSTPAEPHGNRAMRRARRARGRRR